MGDRANAVIVDDVTGQMIYIYSHWGGSEICSQVAEGLRKCGPGQPVYGNRWDDSGRVAAAVFQEMAGGKDTPYAQIALYRRDNEHPVVVLDPRTQEIGLAREGEEPETYVSWTFAEFTEIPLNEDGWPNG